ncbi:hypothetical protein J6590_057604 [Homalodisca vitripennis]|nr:hypothetical protein J6590_057604 [Homalodisca vitripennis]
MYGENIPNKFTLSQNKINQKIALAVASFGIAPTVLEGGRTALPLKIATVRSQTGSLVFYKLCIQMFYTQYQSRIYIEGTNDLKENNLGSADLFGRSNIHVYKTVFLLLSNDCCLVCLSSVKSWGK